MHVLKRMRVCMQLQRLSCVCVLQVWHKHMCVCVFFLFFWGGGYVPIYDKFLLCMSRVTVCGVCEGISLQLTLRSKDARLSADLICGCV